MPHRYDKIKDFKLDKPKSDEWAKHRYDKWLKSSRFEDFRVVHEYIRDSDRLSNILKEYNGDINKIDSNKYPHIKEMFFKLDKLIKSDENKLYSPKDIYIGYSHVDLGLYEKSDLISDKTPTLIDNIHSKNILEKYEFGSLIGFELGNIIKDLDDSHILMLRLTLPEGAYLACLYDGQNEKVMIPSNYSMKINSRKVSTYKGRQIIVLKASLKEKEYVYKKINDTKITLIDKFKSLDKKDSFIEFDIGNGFESYTLDFAKLSIDSLIKNFPKKLYRDCIGDNLNQIIFTDKIIPNTENLDLRGKYNPSDKTLYLRPNNHIFLTSKDPSSDSKSAILHESAHIADKMVLSCSSDLRFIQLFKLEKDKLNEIITYKDYAKTNVSEYFAEVFKSMFSPYSNQRSEINKLAPKSVDFIKRSIDEYI